MKAKVICLLFVNFVTASFASDQWHQGSVVLANGEVRTGFLQLEEMHHVVLLKNNDQTTSVYSGRVVRQVNFYDAEANINRRFVSCKVREGAVVHSKLFEVVTGGLIKVLRLRRHSAESDNSHRDDYEYFTLSNADVQSFSFFRAMVLRGMIESCETLRTYIHKEKLSGYNPADIIMIVQHYNDHVQPVNYASR